MPDEIDPITGTVVSRTPDALIMRGTPGPAGRYVPPEPQPDFGSVQAQVANLPLDQAEAAVEAAMRFQGQRGYQRELAKGTAAPEALAKWAPMIFAGKGRSNLGQAAQMIRATAPKPSYSYVPPAGGAPGYFGGGGLRPVLIPPSITGAPAKDIQPKEFRDPRTGKIRYYNPATGAPWAEPAEHPATVRVIGPGGMEIQGPLTDPTIQSAIRMKGGPGTNLLTAPVTAPAPAAVRAPAPAPVTRTATPAATVRRRTRDGRIAIFDAETKKFIRYAD